MKKWEWKTLWCRWMAKKAPLRFEWQKSGATHQGHLHPEREEACGEVKEALGENPRRHVRLLNMDHENRPHEPKTYQFPRPHDTMSIIIEEASADQTVTQATHSHDFDNGLPSPADLKIAHQINSRYPNASLYIYDRLGYNKYNEFSSTEPNVVVTPSKVFYDDEKTKK